MVMVSGFSPTVSSSVYTFPVSTKASEYQTFTGENFRFVAVILAHVCATE